MTKQLKIEFLLKFTTTYYTEYNILSERAPSAPPKLT
jgi:hypothetical protein